MSALVIAELPEQRIVDLIQRTERTTIQTEIQNRLGRAFTHGRTLSGRWMIIGAVIRLIETTVQVGFNARMPVFHCNLCELGELLTTLTNMSGGTREYKFVVRDNLEVLVRKTAYNVQFGGDFQTTRTPIYSVDLRLERWMPLMEKMTMMIETVTEYLREIIEDAHRTRTQPSDMDWMFSTFAPDRNSANDRTLAKIEMKLACYLDLHDAAATRTTSTQVKQEMMYTFRFHQFKYWTEMYEVVDTVVNRMHLMMTKVKKGYSIEYGDIAAVDDCKVTVYTTRSYELKKCERYARTYSEGRAWDPLTATENGIVGWTRMWQSYYKEWDSEWRTGVALHLENIICKWKGRWQM